jgi:hypothetical protein
MFCDADEMLAWVTAGASPDFWIRLASEQSPPVDLTDGSVTVSLALVAAGQTPSMSTTWSAPHLVDDADAPALRCSLQIPADTAVGEYRCWWRIVNGDAVDVDVIDVPIKCR